MIVISASLTFFVYCNSALTWVKGMFVLCVLQNIASLYFSVARFYEIREAANHPYAASWIVSTAIFFYFVTSILLYWLFGFKYWVISIEVSRFINERTESSNNVESAYSSINKVVISSTVVICLITACLRFKITHELVGVPRLPSAPLKWAITAFYFLVVLLSILSAVFLFDAMKRLRKLIKQ